MRVRIYRASRMVDAMAAIREELGADALILASRRLATGVEVTAAVDIAEAAPAIATGLPPPTPPRRDDRALALAYHAVPDTIRSRLARGTLAQALAGGFRFDPLSAQPGSAPLLLAGPPGAGKTLTTARLATRLVMNGVLPAVLTADGQRAGGAEQLAAFTRVLGLDLLLADHPAALRQVLSRHGGRGPVLIDLPGSNPYVAAEREELAAFAEAAGGRVVLVLPAGLDPAESSDLARAYLRAGATHLVTTRLDLARRLGCVLAAADTGLAIAEASDSPGVADGLIDMTPARLALLLLKAAATPPDEFMNQDRDGYRRE